MTLPRPEDVELLGVTFDADATRGSFVLGPSLVRHDGALYGGTAIAASMVAMEAASQRDVLWITTQFVTSAPGGSVIDMRCDVSASGRRTAQLSVTGSIDNQVVFMSLGSTGIGKDGGLQGQFETMPSVSPPNESSGLFPGPPRPEGPDESAWQRNCEYRMAELLDSPRAGDGTTVVWTRNRREVPMTAVELAFAADMVPLAIARGAGKVGGGTSLDNSMRFSGEADSEWVLLELQGNMASGSYGHGLVRAWSETGRLMAIGSQTANMLFLFDEGSVPFFEPDGN